MALNLFFFYHAFIEFLNFDGLFAFFSVFPFRFDQGFDTISLWWSYEPMIIGCVCLYHLLNIVIIIFGGLRSEWPELDLFRHLEAVVVIQTIEVIKDALNGLREANIQGIGFCQYWRSWHYYIENRCCLILLNARLIHGLLKHFPCVLIFFWQLCEGRLLDWDLSLGDRLLFGSINFLGLWDQAIVLLIIQESFLINDFYVV